MTDLSDDHIEDENENDGASTEYTEPSSIYDMVVDFFCPDEEGDVDEIDFETTEEYYQSEAYTKKYGFYDDMMLFFESADDMDYFEAEAAVEIYLRYTPASEVSQEKLCYLIFNSHVKRHPFFVDHFYDTWETAMAKKTKKQNPDLSREELLEQNGNILNEEQISMLDDLEKKYGFMNLFYDADDILSSYYNKYAPFDVKSFNPEAMELLRIGNFVTMKYDLDYYQSAGNGRRNAKRAKRIQNQIKPFVENSLNFIVRTGRATNENLARDIDDVQDSLLDLLYQVLPSETPPQAKPKLPVYKRKQEPPTP